MRPHIPSSAVGSVSKRSRAVVRLVASGLVLGGLIAAATAFLAQDLYGRAITDTQRNLRSLSLVLADQADRALQTIELVQQALIDEVRGDQITNPAQFVARMSERSQHDALRVRVGALPQINAITVIDHAGKLINFSRYWPIPEVNIADRDYFKALSTDPSLERFVSQPVKNRGDGAWTLYLARKISAPDGTFLGLVLGAVELSYFEKLYAQIAPGPDAVLSMFRTDGMLMVRHPDLNDTVGRVFPQAAASLISAKGDSGGGLIRNVSPIDGQDRLVATHALASFPLIMSVSGTAAASLAAWKQQAVALGGGALLLEIGLILLVVLGVRQIKSKEELVSSEGARAAAEERERGERVSREQYARFGNALNSMTQGLCMFDRRDELVVMNERFAHMYAIPPAFRAPGTPLQVMLAHFDDAAHGAASRAMLDQARLAAACREAATFTCDLDDGRIINVSHAPVPDGGWVCTHDDVTERRQSEAQIAHMARHDALTDLPNRLMLQEHANRVLAGRRQGGRTAALFLDLDGFKRINDAFGHGVGDQLLRAVGTRLQTAVAEAGLVARIGGDEFAVIQDRAEQPRAAALLAERLIAALSAPFEVEGHHLALGASIGIAIADKGCDAAQFVRNADVALHRAKANGRGGVCFFEPSMDAEIQKRRVLEADLRRGVAEGQFEVHYQPLIDARSQSLTGFEALVRWRHPQRGMVSPADFIPISEEIGLIRPIGRWVLEKACADAVTWPAHVKVAVNLSPVQFAEGNLVEEVRLALARSRLPAQRLELEITESVMLQDNEANLRVLRDLHALGVQIAMDDFGTGYSSLSYLRRFPFDKIKIDQSFVRDLGGELDKIEIIRAVVGLGKALGMSVLAEGVETAEQFRILADEGCDEVQGYLFSKPLPLGDLASVISGEQSLKWKSLLTGPRSRRRPTISRPRPEPCAAG